MIIVFLTLLRLVGIEEVAAAGRKLGFYRVIDVLMNYNGLLGSADHAVIEASWSVLSS